MFQIANKTMTRTAGVFVLYGFIIGLVASIIRWIDYNQTLNSWSTEIYAGTIALIFAAGGIWLGRQMRQRKSCFPETTVEVKQPMMASNVKTHQAEGSGLSRRELEVLQLMASGYSNQEIANKLFVSLNTVKTHTSNLYFKLEVKRRTLAVIRGKELGIFAGNHPKK
jgi:DNA-binding CsgD family transcriptional regulator